MSEAETLDRLVIRGNHGRQNFEYGGFIVPDTERLFAVDERHPEWWVITHVPTTWAVTKYGFTDAHTRERAIAKAQYFYREGVARGWPLTTIEPQELTAAVNAVPKEERDSFWEGLRDA